MPSPDAELETLFRETLPLVGAVDSEVVGAQLATYVRLLHKWNQAFNLTSVREPKDMAIRHVLDSLMVRPFLTGSRIADVGCGAGLPGIPLALTETDRHFTLVDSGFKKIRFVRQAVAELGIQNVTAEHCRVEDLPASPPYDTVTCRAFTTLTDFARGSGHLLAPTGKLVAMKGKRPDDELAELPTAWRAESVTPVSVPRLEAERHIVVLVRAT